MIGKLYYSNIKDNSELEIPIKSQKILAINLKNYCFSKNSNKVLFIIKLNNKKLNRIIKNYVFRFSRLLLDFFVFFKLFYSSPVFNVSNFERVVIKAKFFDRKEKSKIINRLICDLLRLGKYHFKKKWKKGTNKPRLGL
uniref:Uncharacterized protein n=1 Tax=Amorphochlora amoebiformis TaxID=1561963 RepID=A0A0H5BQZ4_9EUKA|nr:hypothetical protein [Amorphochlora amoebiformis]